MKTAMQATFVMLMLTAIVYFAQATITDKAISDNIDIIKLYVEAKHR